MSKYKPYYPKKKKKQEIGFFSALFHCAIICFVFMCLAIVITHKSDYPTQQTEISTEDELKQEIADEPALMPSETLLKQVDAKTINQKEMICLAKNIFFEARGTDEKERIRVINVTTNRVHSDKFPTTYCGVVYDPSQFSWTLNLIEHNVTKIIARYTVERAAWNHAKEMATYELAYGYKDLTGGSLYYHTYGVDPHWDLKQVVATNYHIYYKPY